MPNLEISPAAQVYYEDDDFTDPWRDSPAILLQHGFSRSGKFWYNWVPPLGREFRILRPDLRGMGRSTMAEKDYEPDLDTFAGDILHLLDHLEIQRVVFVGESFGGIIGLKFAHAFPQRTRALVLCNTPCRLPRRRGSRQGIGTRPWPRESGPGPPPRSICDWTPRSRPKG